MENKGKRPTDAQNRRTSASEGPMDDPNDDCDDYSHDDTQPLTDDDNEDDAMREFEVTSRDNLKDGTYVLVQDIFRRSL